jgi:SAM-dependent methyltransferase
VSLFDVAAESYDRFMGGFSRQLAPQMADLAGVMEGRRVLDVGCGTGALTGELVRRVGAASVSAVDPSADFVAAARARYPGVDVRVSSAEALPFADRSFDATCAQLVVHFMTDPVRGIAEMARVTRHAGAVVACVWDHGGESPLGPFWHAAHEVVPGADDQQGRAGVREGHLAELFRAAGLADVRSGSIRATVVHGTFEEWWSIFELGVGPAGKLVATLDERARAEVRDRCRRTLGPGPVSITARAWTAVGLA